MTASNNSNAAFVYRVTVAAGVISTAAALIGLLIVAPDAFLLFFAGVLAALFIHAPAKEITTRAPIPYWLALGLCLLVLFGLATLFFWLLVPAVAQQVSALAADIPVQLQTLQQRLSKAPQIAQWVESIPSRLSQLGLLSKAPGAIFGALGLIGNLVLIFFLALFLAGSPSTYRDGFLRLFPKGRRSRLNEVLLETGTTLEHWLWGKLVLMIAAGTMTGVALWALNIPLAIALGVLAGLAEFVPNLGPLLAAVPAVLLAFTHDPSKALYVVLAYIGVQTVQSYVLTPWVQRKAVNIPPALLLIGQIVMTVLFGLFGLALATPLLAAGLVLVRRLYVEDALSDDLAASAVSESRAR